MFSSSFFFPPLTYPEVLQIRLTAAKQATASIDLPTALRIQQVLAEEMEASTVITIAHRVEAVRRADWVVVLGEGSVRRVGSVAEVLGEGEG